MHVHYPKTTMRDHGVGLNVISIITVTCCRHSRWISIDEEDETQRGGIRITGKVKAKYGRRAKSEDAP